jgi:hypothetical protein
MNGTLKLKAEWLSTDGGKTWICTHQYFLTDPQRRAFQDITLEGRTFRMNEENNNDRPIKPS